MENPTAPHSLEQQLEAEALNSDLGWCHPQGSGFHPVQVSPFLSVSCGALRFPRNGGWAELFWEGRAGIRVLCPCPSSPLSLSSALAEVYPGLSSASESKPELLPCLLPLPLLPLT